MFRPRSFLPKVVGRMAVVSRPNSIWRIACLPLRKAGCQEVSHPRRVVPGEGLEGCSLELAPAAHLGAPEQPDVLGTAE